MPSGRQANPFTHALTALRHGARMTHARSAIRIGCAGWSIDRGSADAFAAGASVLARYASVFDCVEINSSFHRPHRPDTYARWAQSVPPAFRFSVKLPATITHDARLQGVGADLSRFLDEVAGLGHKLGGLLVQLPPSLAYEARVAGTFFAMLRRRTAVPVACEPRHASWFDPAVEGLWLRYGISRVAADPAPLPAGAGPGGCGAWRYWRLHGSPRMYYSRYDDDALAAIAHGLSERASRDRPAWCIFDNTAHGHATANALRLRSLVVPRPRHAAPTRSA